MLCAWLPLCWHWGRGGWIGKLLVGVLFVMLLLTQSRTGLLVAGAEAAAWWWMRGMSGDAGTRRPRPLKVLAFVGLIALAAVWWMAPRMSLDGSILNRPKIWLAGLRLFAANPNGVGLGNFDWPVLFDLAEQGGLGMANWVLSWAMFALFVGLGVWLIAGMMRRPHRGRPAVAVALAGVAVLGLRIVSVGNAPQVRDGYVIRGEAPRTLALYDESWKLKTVAQRVKGGAVLPVRGVAEFPRELDWSGIDKVMLFGDCREWKHLVKGLAVECEEE